MVDDKSEYKKAEYKNVWLNKKNWRHSMNRILSIDHRIDHENEINKISLPCSHGKIYIQNNGYDGFALVY